MKKRLYVVVVAALVVVIGGLSAYGIDHNNAKQIQSQNQTSTSQTIAKITYSNGGKQVDYVGQTGKTALEVLKSLTKVDVGTSSFGEFVTGINGLKADAKLNYWSFYVNEAYASEGAGTYKSKDGEKLQWRQENLQP